MADPITLPVQKIAGDDPWGMRVREKLRELISSVGPSPAEQAAQQEEASRQFADMATSTGMISKGAAYLFGPMAGAAPASPLATAALAGTSGALNAYASDTEHKAGPALQRGAAAALLGGGASAVGRGVSGLQAPAAQAAAPSAAVAAEQPITPAPPTPLKGSWDKAKMEQVLGNATARKAMKGESVATSEKVLQRMAEQDKLTRDPNNMVPVAKVGKEMLKKLSPEEREAVRRWVHTNSSAIQAADAAGDTTSEYGKLAQTLKSVAEKHPSPPATLYRGAHLPAEAVDEMAQSGKMVAPRMESWSTNPETSGAFARGKDVPGKVPVVFRQHGASGLALNPLESEVLIPSARAYRVAGVTKAADGTHIVDVVQAARP